MFLVLLWVFTYIPSLTSKIFTSVGWAKLIKTGAGYSVTAGSWKLSALRDITSFDTEFWRVGGRKAMVHFWKNEGFKRNFSSTVQVLFVCFFSVNKLNISPGCTILCNPSKNGRREL